MLRRARPPAVSSHSDLSRQQTVTNALKDSKGLFGMGWCDSALSGEVHMQHTQGSELKPLQPIRFLTGGHSGFAADAIW